jgi:hypothetical protein
MTGGAWLVLSWHPEARTDLITSRVHYDHLDVTVAEHGTIASSRSKDIICRVKARKHGSSVATTIKWVIDDGTPVRRGTVVAELDDSSLQEDLKEERIALTKARADWLQAEESYKIVESQNQEDIQNAQAAAVLADIDFNKYLKGDYVQNHRDVEGRVAMAQSDLEMWRGRVLWTERMVRKGFQSAQQARADHSALQNASMALDNAREEQRVLEDFTKRRQVADLSSKRTEARLALARSKSQARAKSAQADIDRISKKTIYLRELQHYQDIEDQILECTVHAPQSGMVVYAKSGQARSGSGAQQGIIAQGEPVREGQLLMQIPDLSRLIVETSVHEAEYPYVRAEQRSTTGFCEALQAGLLLQPTPLAQLAGQGALDELHDRLAEREDRLVSRGEEAVIRLHAFPDHPLHGHVTFVANVPSSVDWTLADVKVYRTLVAVDEPLPGLKPGMTADVIFVGEHPLEHVLTVPLEALVRPVRQGEAGKCYVVTAQGPEEHEIQIGLNNETKVEVKNGLHEGDEVVLNPVAIHDEQEHGVIGLPSH